MLFKKKKIVTTVDWPLNPGNPKININDYENTKEFFEFFDMRELDPDFFVCFNYIRIIHRELGGILFKSASLNNGGSETRIFEKLKKKLSAKHPDIRWGERGLIFYDEEEHAMTLVDNIFYAWTGFSVDLSEVKWLTTDGSKVIFQYVNGEESAEDFGIASYYVNDAIQHYLVEKCRMTLLNIGRNIDGTIEAEDNPSLDRIYRYRSIFYGGVKRIIPDFDLLKNVGMKDFMLHELLKRYIYTEASKRIVSKGRLEEHNEILDTASSFEARLFDRINKHNRSRKELNSISWREYYESTWTVKKQQNVKNERSIVRTDGVYHVPMEHKGQYYGYYVMFFDNKTVAYGNMLGPFEIAVKKMPERKRWSYETDEEGVIHFHDDIRDRNIAIRVVEDGITVSYYDKSGTFHFYKN